jgi:hypothetical protein
MVQHGSRTTSRSLAIYRLLLELYPWPFLQQHRAEMLRNFEDLEQESQSRTALWLFIGKDLAVSLRSQFIKTLGGQTAIILLVLAALLAYTELHAVARKKYPIEGFCYGYMIGWFAGWFGKWWQASSVSRVPGSIRSLPTQATIVVGVLALVSALAIRSGAQEHFIWALCYGVMLAWIAAWLGKRWQTRP